MAFVYFSDADDVVHKVPCDLTHFEPNDESTPYILDKLPITYVSGRTREHKVDKFYFQVINDYLDETDPAFTAYTSDAGGKGAFIADFVRFIGSRKLVRVIVNYWIYGIFQGSLDGIHMGFLSNMIDDDRLARADVTISNYWNMLAKRYILEKDPRRLYGPMQYSATMLFIVDTCEHTRDIIDYVKTSTNEMYAKCLDCFQVQIDKLLADLNPTKHVNTMKWLMNDFEKIPRRIRDAWLASE